MLGKVLRIRGSSFRMLPNPTSDLMVKQVGRKPAWKIARLMQVFQDKLKELSDGSYPNSSPTLLKFYCLLEKRIANPGRD